MNLAAKVRPCLARKDCMGTVFKKASVRVRLYDGSGYSKGPFTNVAH